MTPSNSESNIQTYSQNEKIIAASILLAFERTATKPERIEGLLRDVLNEFDYLPTEQITEAIKKGSLGYFGSCYKISTLQICLWIREFIKNERTFNGLKVGDIVKGMKIIFFTEDGRPVFEGNTKRATKIL